MCKQIRQIELTERDVLDTETYFCDGCDMPIPDPKGAIEYQQIYFRLGKTMYIRDHVNPNTYLFQSYNDTTISKVTGDFLGALPV